jgi:hypothetical protein
LEFFISDHSYIIKVRPMHIMKSLLRLAISTACLLSLPVAALEQDKESLTLVGNIVRAYGGAEAIERIAAVNAEGEIKTLMRNESGSYKRWFKRSRQLRVETAYSHSAETRLLAVEQVWRSGVGNALKLVSGPSHLAVVYQYKQLDLPYGLLKGGYNLRYAGKESLNGMETEVMEVWDDEGPPMRVNVDAASHYIVGVSGRLSQGGHSMALAVEFSDFKPVEGMPMPFQLRNHAGGQPVSETVIRRYTVNPPDDPSLFEVPVKGHHGKVLSSIGFPSASQVRGHVTRLAHQEKRP